MRRDFKGILLCTDYAVENAHPAVREAADRITVHASKGAIAQIIYDLEKSI